MHIHLNFLFCMFNNVNQFCPSIFIKRWMLLEIIVNLLLQKHKSISYYNTTSLSSLSYLYLNDLSTVCESSYTASFTLLIYCLWTSFCGTYHNNSNGFISGEFPDSDSQNSCV